MELLQKTPAIDRAINTLSEFDQSLEEFDTAHRFRSRVFYCLGFFSGFLSGGIVVLIVWGATA